jgi:hypothetical protein
MFNQESKTGWFPYVIPPTPIRDGNSEYALSFRGDGDPEKNPSEFLEWRKINESGSECVGLNLYKKTVGSPPNTAIQVWIGAGTIAGQIPSGFDNIQGKFVVSSGSGLVWARVTINQSNGNLQSVSIDNGSSVPSNTNTNFHYPLGAYQYSGGSPTITNYGCGSLDVSICRNWFRATAPFYGVSFNR